MNWLVWITLVLVGAFLLGTAVAAKHDGAPAWVLGGLWSLVAILALTIGIVWPTGATL